MNKIMYHVLGTVFIITGGIVYTWERFIAYFSWVGQLNENPHSTNPDLPLVFTNVFVPIFVVIGVVYICLGFKKKG